MTATANGGHWVKVPHWVVRSPHLDPFETKVFMYLLSRANASGKTWPYRSTIARETGISEAKVKRSVTRLAELGLVTVTAQWDQSGAQRENLYRVKLDATEPTPGSEGAGGSAEIADPPIAGNRPPALTDPHKKNQRTRTNELEPSFEVAATPQRDKNEKKTIWWATPTQLSYLSDLTILAGEQPPTQVQIDHWIEQLTAEQASDRIDDYLQAIGRGIDYAGPHEGDPEYEHLSDTGKTFADAEMLPDN